MFFFDLLHVHLFCAIALLFTLECLEWGKCTKMKVSKCTTNIPCRSQSPRPKPFGWRGVVALFTLGSSLQQRGM